MSFSSCYCRHPDKTAVAEEDTDALGPEKLVEVHPVPSNVAASVPLEVPSVPLEAPSVPLEAPSVPLETASGRQMAQQQERVAVASTPPLRPAQSTCHPLGVASQTSVHRHR